MESKQADIHTKCTDPNLEAAPLMLGVQTAFGSLLLESNSFALNGCPGKKALRS